MDNIPVIKLGLVAVSRDCFPIALSEMRRAAIAAKLAKKRSISWRSKRPLKMKKTCWKRLKP